MRTTSAVVGTCKSGSSCAPTTRQAAAAGSSKWPVTSTIAPGTNCAGSTPEPGATYTSSVGPRIKAIISVSPGGTERWVRATGSDRGHDAAVPGGARLAAGGHHSHAGSTWVWQSTIVATGVAWNVRADRPKQASRCPGSRARIDARSGGGLGQPPSGERTGSGATVGTLVGVGPWLATSDGCDDGFPPEQPTAAADSTSTPSSRPSRGRIGRAIGCSRTSDGQGTCVLRALSAVRPGSGLFDICER